jgi:PST family polysaccharide transporter
MTVPICIFCGLFAEDIVLVILGPKWIEAAATFRLLVPTIFVFGIINPTGWLLQSIGLQGRSLRIALVIAPLVIASYFVGLPYGANGIALAFSTAMTLWLVPHVVWCLHGTMISPRDLFVATGRPLLASIVAGAVSFSVQRYFGHLHSPFLRLSLEGGVMVTSYLCIFLFVMGQKTFYFELLRGLRNSSHAT